MLHMPFVKFHAGVTNIYFIFFYEAHYLNHKSKAKQMNTYYNFTKSDKRGDGAENCTAAQQIRWSTLLAN